MRWLHSVTDHRQRFSPPVPHWLPYCCILHHFCLDHYTPESVAQPHATPYLLHSRTSPGVCRSVDLFGQQSAPSHRLTVFPTTNGAYHAFVATSTRRYLATLYHGQCFFELFP